MINPFDTKLIIGICLLLMLPISNAYYEALRLAKLPVKDHAILGSIALFVSMTAMCFSFILIEQISNASFSAINFTDNKSSGGVHGNN